MYTQESIQRIASKIAAEPIVVEYTEKNKPNHIFTKGKDKIKVYDNPSLVKRFTAVLLGKEWEDGDVKTLIRFNDLGNSSFATGKEDPIKLGKPVVWKSLPVKLQKILIDNLGGKYAE